MSKSISGQIVYKLMVIILITAIVYALQSIVIPILFAILFSVLLLPLCLKFENMGMSRIMSSIMSIIIVFLLGGALLLVVASQVISIGENYFQIVGSVEGVLKKGVDLFQSYTKIQINKEDVGKYITQVASLSGQYVVKGVSSIGGVVAGIVLVIIYAFFFLYYREFFKDFIVKVFKLSNEESVLATLDKMYMTIHNYIKGQFTVMVIVAILNTLGLWFLKVDYALFFGVLASLLMVLPYIGIAIGSILPILFALATKDSYWYAVGVLVWFQLVQTLEGNFLTPKIVGGKISLNPMMTMLAVLLGGLLFGFAGLMLALPFIAVLKVVFDAVPRLEPLSFLLGEPDNKYFKINKKKKKK